MAELAVGGGAGGGGGYDGGYGGGGRDGDLMSSIEPMGLMDTVGGVRVDIAAGWQVYDTYARIFECVSSYVYYVI